MNKAERPSFMAKDDNQAREGRQLDKTGKELGDVGFHENAMGLTPEKEKDQLEKLGASVVEIEEAQATDIARNNPVIGAKAFEELLQKHPNDPRAEEWRQTKKSLLEKN